MRSPFGVTARYIDFLFNREETVVTSRDELRDLIYQHYPETHQSSAVNFMRAGQLANMIFDKGYRPMHWAEGDWQLPPSDESKVGED